MVHWCYYVECAVVLLNALVVVPRLLRILKPRCGAAVNNGNAQSTQTIDTHAQFGQTTPTAAFYSFKSLPSSIRTFSLWLLMGGVLLQLLDSIFGISSSQTVHFFHSQATILLTESIALLFIATLDSLYAARQRILPLTLRVSALSFSVCFYLISTAASIAEMIVPQADEATLFTLLTIRAVVLGLFAMLLISISVQLLRLMHRMKTRSGQQLEMMSKRVQAARTQINLQMDTQPDTNYMVIEINTVDDAHSVGPVKSLPKKNATKEQLQPPTLPRRTFAKPQPSQSFSVLQLEKRVRTPHRPRESTFPFEPIQSDPHLHTIAFSSGMAQSAGQVYETNGQPASAVIQHLQELTANLRSTSYITLLLNVLVICIQCLDISNDIRDFSCTIQGNEDRQLCHFAVGQLIKGIFFTFTCMVLLRYTKKSEAKDPAPVSKAVDCRVVRKVLTAVPSSVSTDSLPHTLDLKKQAAELHRFTTDQDDEDIMSKTPLYPPAPSLQEDDAAASAGNAVPQFAPSLVIHTAFVQTPAGMTNLQQCS